LKFVYTVCLFCWITMFELISQFSDSKTVSNVWTLEISIAPYALRIFMLLKNWNYLGPIQRTYFFVSVCACVFINVYVYVYNIMCYVYKHMDENCRKDDSWRSHDTHEPIIDCIGNRVGKKRTTFVFRIIRIHVYIYVQLIYTTTIL
jgi:hypothetical protein